MDYSSYTDHYYPSTIFFTFSWILQSWKCIKLFNNPSCELSYGCLVWQTVKSMSLTSLTGVPRPAQYTAALEFVHFVVASSFILIGTTCAFVYIYKEEVLAITGYMCPYVFWPQLLIAMRYMVTILHSFLTYKMLLGVKMWK